MEIQAEFVNIQGQKERNHRPAHKSKAVILQIRIRFCKSQPSTGQKQAYPAMTSGETLDSDPKTVSRSSISIPKTIERTISTRFKPCMNESRLALAAHPAKPDMVPSLTATACLTRTSLHSRST